MKKRRKKRLLPLFSLCLATVVILTMPGMKVHAAEIYYDIYVAGVQVTSDNAGNVLAGTDNDGKVQYDPATNTLTLNGANIAFESTIWYCPLDIRQNLTIQLIGQNVIQERSTGRRTDVTYTIRGRGDLTFCGDGSLEIGGGEAEYRKELYAILCEGNLTMQDCTLTATTGDCLIDLYAIWCNGDFTLQGGTLTAATGKCTSASKTTGRNNQAIVAKGNISITGGELNAASGQASQLGLSSAIFTACNIEISDAKVSAVSGGGLDSYAMNANQNLTIRNSEVACTGGDAGNYSVGIRCESKADGDVIGTLIISDSTITAASGGAGLKSVALLSTELQADNSHITAEGGNSSGSVDGIHTNERVTLRKCEVNAEAGQADGDCSLGWWCSELEAHDSCITAKGGTAAAESYGISAAGFTLRGGNIRAEAGGASDWSIGLWTNGANISAGTLVAIAGQADSTNAITLSPVFADDYKAAVKAGTCEEDAVAIEMPTDDTYQSNTYVIIEPYAHLHDWAEGWMSDDTHHWHVCRADDCNITEHTQMDAYEEHTYDDAYDADCNVCGAMRTVPDIPVEPSYQIIDGADSRWIIEGEGSLSIRGNGEFAKFVEVRVDGMALTAEYYDVSSGSTIVTLKAAYLNTLAAGSHNIEIVWTDGSAGTTFTVAENTPPSNTDSDSNSNTGATDSDSDDNRGGDGSDDNRSDDDSDDNTSDDSNSSDNNTGVAADSQVNYMVMRGDTLGKIAKRNNISLIQLLSWNPQIKNPNLIFPGQVIVVGYAKGSITLVPNAPAGVVYDEVRRGDSLYKIAIRNGLTLNTIMALNPEIANQKYIYSGQKIRVK